MEHFNDDAARSAAPDSNCSKLAWIKPAIETFQPISAARGITDGGNGDGFDNFS